MKQIIKTTKAPQAIGPYSQGMVADKFIYTAGQIHLTASGVLVEGTIEEQTEQVMKNLSEILIAAGSSFDHVVKTTMYLADIGDFAKANAVYMKYMSEPYPARDTVGVYQLPKGARIEISMIAMKE